MNIRCLKCDEPTTIESPCVIVTDCLPLLIRLHETASFRGSKCYDLYGNEYKMMYEDSYLIIDSVFVAQFKVCNPNKRIIIRKATAPNLYGHKFFLTQE